MIALCQWQIAAPAQRPSRFDFDAVGQRLSAMSEILDRKAMDKVERLKNDANRSLMEKRPIEAIGIYGEAIAIQPSAVLHSNRAAAYLRLGRWEHAITDADEALKLDGAYAKAWCERARLRNSSNRAKRS